MPITVCIAGMHRAGTSLVSRLINVCGIEMGTAAEFAPPAQDNPEGFGENLKFVRLNEQILARFAGAWDYPPALEKGWENSPQLLPVRSQAAQVIQPFLHVDAWGWKDPRNSLTLPFWQSFIPNLKVIICLRNPLSVVDSLRKRSGYTSDQFGFSLWEHYYRSALANTQPHNRIITHYDSYFYNAGEELTRIFRFLEVDVSPAIIDTAGQLISADLRHHYVSVAHTLGSSLPASTKKLYLDMCAAAGSVYQLYSFKHDTVEPESWAALANNLGPEYMYALQEQRLLQQIAEKEENLAALQNQLSATQASLQAKEQELEAVYGSRAWQLTQKLQQLYAVITGNSRPNA